MNILLIEDEPAMASVVKRGLQEARFDVDWKRTGTEGFEAAAHGDYALIILDLMLPGMDGWLICQELRVRRNTTPILMLTARDAVQDRVKGLDLGADDYLAKPFDFTELLARVRALLRRDKVHKTRVIRIADLEIDTAGHRVKCAGKELELTPREYKLLEALAMHEGRVLTREAIQSRVWMDDESSSNTVDVFIGTLRKKIDSGRKTKLIHTVHGLGYSLRAPSSLRVNRP
jgi:two-component system copper resistance phosphate regulon response regulator CusR